MDVDDDGAVRDLVANFVSRELLPLENGYLERAAAGLGPHLEPEQEERLRRVSRELGLWGLDAPEALGGMDLTTSVMVGVWEEMGRTPIPFQLPPDSPNLRMLQAIGTPEQKERFLRPYVEGRMRSAIAISEPGAGGDPSAISTRAVRDGEDWVLDGRKIWISSADVADFVIVMARVGEGAGPEEITAFIVERGTQGFVVGPATPMLRDIKTFEVLFEACRVPGGALLGQVGRGYAPMQLRLRARRLEMACTAVGFAQRALEVMGDHAKQRRTFGVRLADRQAVQWWVADIATRLHACRLMIADAAAKVDAGHDASQEISMIKVYATETAYDACDHAMQTLGALGMTQSTVLHPMWQHARLMRIYEGPSEVHRQSIARRILR